MMVFDFFQRRRRSDLAGSLDDDTMNNRYGSPKECVDTHFDTIWERVTSASDAELDVMLKTLSEERKGALDSSARASTDSTVSATATAGQPKEKSAPSSFWFRQLWSSFDQSGELRPSIATFGAVGALCFATYLLGVNSSGSTSSAGESQPASWSNPTPWLAASDLSVRTDAPNSAGPAGFGSYTDYAGQSPGIVLESDRQTDWQQTVNDSPESDLQLVSSGAQFEGTSSVPLFTSVAFNRPLSSLHVTLSNRDNGTVLEAEMLGRLVASRAFLSQINAYAVAMQRSQECDGNENTICGNSAESIDPMYLRPRVFEATIVDVDQGQYLTGRFYSEPDVLTVFSLDTAIDQFCQSNPEDTSFFQCTVSGSYSDEMADEGGELPSLVENTGGLDVEEVLNPSDEGSPDHP